MATILVVAPHPDDETLGCGGTLLKHAGHGDQVYWLIMTKMSPVVGYSAEQISIREEEIKKVVEAYHFEKVFPLQYATTMLDTVPRRELMAAVSKVVKEVQPTTIYLPNRSDIHSDHRVTFETVMGAIKTFRAPSVKRVLAYEVLSETEFAPSLPTEAFMPNSFSDISDYLEKKIEIMHLYEGELGTHPFPRSAENIRALATLRGATAGVQYAEAFTVLKEIV
ncbi:PIG-L family deacetylase [Candidatus Uhrbacteria bacterium]|nr:PIG-L family deacetylase [Candidatus Uhrbacteria bacterium]